MVSLSRPGFQAVCTTWPSAAGGPGVSVLDGDGAISAGVVRKILRAIEVGAAVQHYHVTVTREGKWWMVRIPEIDGLTQARRLREAPVMAREYIAASLGLTVDDIIVDVHIAAVGRITDIGARLKAIDEQRARAKELERRATAETASLAKELAAEVPLRDVGAVLGVSYQRARQLVQS